MKRDQNNNQRAKKSLGQNFLVDKNYVEKIISALDLEKDETVVEIGAGKGALTKSLVSRAEKVIAIELDESMTSVLLEKFSTEENFILMEKDVLDVDFRALLSLQSLPNKTKLVANLPYYISTAILQHLTQHRSSFSLLVLMLQNEVVNRITAKTGNSERGFLTVLVEAYFKSEKLFDVPPGAFYPKPKIWSSVIKLVPRKSKIRNESLYREIVGLSFTQKRKTIKNNLKNAKGDLRAAIEKKGGLSKILEETEIEPTRRAESISIREWILLTDFIDAKIDKNGD